MEKPKIWGLNLVNPWSLGSSCIGSHWVRPWQEKLNIPACSNSSRKLTQPSCLITLILSVPLFPPLGDVILHFIHKIDEVRWKRSHLSTKLINPLVFVWIAFSSLRGFSIKDNLSTILSYSICSPNYPYFYSVISSVSTGSFSFI